MYIVNTRKYFKIDILIILIDNLTNNFDVTFPLIDFTSFSFQ